MFIQAPSGDVYAKPIKKKPNQNTENQNGINNDTYANMKGWNGIFILNLLEERNQSTFGNGSEEVVVMF